MFSAGGIDPDPTILADFATNLFAVCLIVVIMTLASGGSLGPETGPSDASPPAMTDPIDANANFDLVQRSPLGPEEMVEHLRMRLAPESGISIDLRRDQARIVMGGRAFPSRGPAAPDASFVPTLVDALAMADPRQPVRLYVFDADLYGAAIATLRDRGRIFVEMSVPRALQTSDDWSGPFLALSGAAGDEKLFRSGLARILDASPDTARRGTGEHFSSGFAASGRPVALSERIRAKLEFLGAVGLPLLAGAAIIFVEWRAARRLSAASNSGVAHD